MNNIHPLVQEALAPFGRPVTTYVCRGCGTGVPSCDPQNPPKGWHTGARCDSCFQKDHEEVCPACSGTGEDLSVDESAPWTPCPVCLGYGLVWGLEAA